MNDGLSENSPFTKVQNDVLERLAGVGLSGREFRLLFVIWRKTWGWGKKKDKITLSQFSHLSGIDRRKCHVLLSDLIEKRIIKKSVAVNGNRKIINYSFNNIFSEWRVLPPRGTRKKEKDVPKNGNIMLPSKATKLLPSTAHTKERKKDKESDAGVRVPPEDTDRPPYFWHGVVHLNGRQYIQHAFADDHTSAKDAIKNLFIEKGGLSRRQIEAGIFLVLKAERSSEVTA